MFYYWKLFEDKRTEEWERDNSSLGRENSSASFVRCRKYACIDISKRTHINIENGVSVFEIPKGKEFHFIGRVDTTRSGNDPKEYYQDFKKRKYAAFSTINHKNISRYKGGIFFLYNIMPEDIVHIFPMDSDNDRNAQTEKTLSGMPSIWLNLNDLEKLTNYLKGYNQVTCKTTRNGEIIRPIAVCAFDELDHKVMQVAQEFGLPVVLCHPEKTAIKYYHDMLYDYGQLQSNTQKLEKLYNINVNCMAYWD